MAFSRWYKFCKAKAVMKNHSASPPAKDAVLSSQKPTHDQIAARAYELYIQNGRQEGRSMEYWLRAERTLTQERARATEPAKPIESHLLRPLDSRQQPFARDERGSASREEIRRETSPMRPASRQSLRPQERSRQAR
jgi:hypothetical protein